MLIYNVLLLIHNENKLLIALNNLINNVDTCCFNNTLNSFILNINGCVDKIFSINSTPTATGIDDCTFNHIG